MYSISVSENLQRILKKLYKKNKSLYEICMKKIEEIAQNPEHYKPLRYDLKNIRSVHIMRSFVLVFRIEKNTIKFLDLDHHDKIYRKRFSSI